MDGRRAAERLSRLATTSALLDEVGATRGPVFGRFSDSELYSHLLAVDSPFFIDLAEEFAAFFEKTETPLVVGDGSEGYNSGHDVCRLLIDAAVTMTNRRTGWTIRNLAYPLADHPDVGDRADLRLTLDANVWRRKMTAARAYPELAGEVERAVTRHGTGAFAVETLIALAPFALPAGPAIYERYGAARVADGKYPALIRQSDHLAPIAEALRRHAQGGVRCAA
jgi:hypothetical protein